VNLELAKMFIDQLVMIQEKTRGNLSSEEATVLRNTLANLQMAFVEVSQSSRGGGAPAPAASDVTPPEPTQQPPAADATAAAPADSPAAAAGEGESRKKFTKSYGA
jgi:hypothetical protein